MTPIVWSKAVADCRALLVWLAVLVFFFACLFVWLSSKIELPAFSDFLINALPKDWERLSGVPFSEVATPAGRIALAYVDPVVLFALVVWSISRGSDIVAGELERGTLEMMLAQPVRRIEVFVSQAVVATVGLALLCVALWIGTWVGLTLVRLPAEVAARPYWPAAANLFGMGFLLMSVTSLVSACSNYRFRVIGLAGGFYVAAMVLKIIGRMAPTWHWLAYGSFLSAVEPQAFVGRPEQALEMLLRYNGVLLGIGLLAYIAAAIIFCRRDLPAPL